MQKTVKTARLICIGDYSSVYSCPVYLVLVRM